LLIFTAFPLYVLFFVFAFLLSSVFLFVIPAGDLLLSLPLFLACHSERSEEPPHFAFAFVVALPLSLSGTQTPGNPTRLPPASCISCPQFATNMSRLPRI
jgi:hypothetical protein